MGYASQTASAPYIGIIAAAERIRKPDSQINPDTDARRQKPDQRRDSRSNNKGGLNRSEQQALHHGPVFFPHEDSCQKRDGVRHSDRDGIKERICLAMDRIGSDRRRGSDDRQHSVHKNTAERIPEPAYAGRHPFSEDRTGLSPGETSEMEAEETVFFAERTLLGKDAY